MVMGRMDDLISRQAAIEVASRECHELRGVFSYIEHGLKELPSEQKTGKWINYLNDNGHHLADCSECGHALQWFDDEDEPRYCCICGSYNGGIE